jgi:hypothetical protein
LFDKFNPYWDNYDRKKNAIFVGLVLGELNELLQTRGYVLLNEAFLRLGFECTPSGERLGWRKYPHCDDGDAFISFGIWDQGFRTGLDWLEGASDLVVLRFNVDITPVIDNERGSTQ